jgi:hypothetical protein
VITPNTSTRPDSRDRKLASLVSTAIWRMTWAHLGIAELLLNRLGIRFDGVSLRFGRAHLHAQQGSCRSLYPALQILFGFRRRGALWVRRRWDSGTT